MYIGRKPQRLPWLRSCLLIAIIVMGTAYASFLLLATRGVYVAPTAWLPESLHPTATITPTPTEPAINIVNRADGYFQNGQVDKAIDEYRRVIEVEPDDALAHARLARLLILRRKFSEAEDLARLAVELNPDDAYNNAVLGLALDWQGKYDDALPYALRAVDIDPNNVFAQAYLSELYSDMGRVDKSVPGAKKAIELDDNSFEAHRALGYAYETSGKYRNAITEYQRAIQIAPNLGFLYVAAARNLRGIGQYRNALALIQQAIQADPNSAEVYDEFGWIYYFLGDYDAAINELKHAPAYAPAHGHLGIVYFVLQNWNSAVPNFETAISLGAERTEYYYSLGLAYINLDNCPKGKEWIDKALNVNPDDTAVQAAEQYYNENCLGRGAPPTRRPTAIPQP
jgi:tetratricopeptide (TPR) repeat protein